MESNAIQGGGAYPVLKEKQAARTKYIQAMRIT